MFKINLKEKTPYAEESQPNPLQWAILSRNPDDSFNQESAWIICKDFFNDLAYTIQTGDQFSIYGFNAGIMSPPKAGEYVYMALRRFKPHFLDNVHIFNEHLHEQGIPKINFSNAGEYILVEWPSFFFTNTYYISLASLIIRLCNYDMKFNSWSDLTSCKTFPTKDQLKWDKVVQKGVYFNLPEELQSYVWYYNKTSNSKVDTPKYQLPGLVHNCGVLAWQNGF